MLHVISVLNLPATALENNRLLIISLKKEKFSYEPGWIRKDGQKVYVYDVMVHSTQTKGIPFSS